MSPYSPIFKPCGEWFFIKDAIYIDLQRYVPPYGCTGGAYWTSDEGHVVCPKCGFLNRTYERVALAEYSYRRYFKTSMEAYEPEQYGFNNRRLRFDNNAEYPYPKHVKDAMEVSKLKLEAAQADARAHALREKAAQLQESLSVSS